VAHQCWRLPKKTNSKKQYMLNIEEKKNRQDKNGTRKMEREYTTNHLDQAHLHNVALCQGLAPPDGQMGDGPALLNQQISMIRFGTS